MWNLSKFPYQVSTSARTCVQCAYGCKVRNAAALGTSHQSAHTYLLSPLAHPQFISHTRSTPSSSSVFLSQPQLPYTLKVNHAPKYSPCVKPIGFPFLPTPYGSTLPCSHFFDLLPLDWTVTLVISLVFPFHTFPSSVSYLAPPPHDTTPMLLETNGEFNCLPLFSSFLCDS